MILAVGAVFYRLFSVVNSSGKRKSTVLPDETILESDITETGKEKKKVKDDPKFLSPEWRIRRLYTGLVLSKEEDRAKLRIMTTGEIEKRDDILSEVTDIYNRTRYADENGGKENVRRMQKLVKENKKSSK